MDKQKSFTAAVKEYFGTKPGQSLKDFAAELKALTYEDKLEIAAGLRAQGLDCADPTVPIGAAA